MPGTKAQQRAIEFREGPAMVLAGPGSGKTFVLTKRIQYLLENGVTDPEKILVITFTRAAASEMRTRFMAQSREILKDCKIDAVSFGTCHAVFFQILKKAYHFTGANILQQKDRNDLLRALLSKYRSASDEEALEAVSSEISRVKNLQIDAENYEPLSCPREIFLPVFKSYEEAKKREQRLDFDDMLCCTLRLLKERPDILKIWQMRWRYLLVDEFQDISRLQYEILRLIAAPEKNLFIVGDDDQSIYGFRGASPGIMLAFPKDYPDAEIILLEENFRSVKNITRAAGRVIAENKTRYPKKCISARPDGTKPDIKIFSNQEHESLYLANQIQKRLKEGLPLNEIAILSRTRRGALVFAARLTEFNLPYRLRGKMPNLFEHWISSDLIAYLNLAAGELKRSDFLRVMNRPERFLKRESLTEDPLSFDAMRRFYEGDSKAVLRLDRFESELKLLSGFCPYAAVNYIRYGMQYEKFVYDYAKRRRLNPEEFVEILEEIQQSAKPFRTLKEWYAYMENFQERQKEDKKNENDNNQAVSLMTLHASKGLEFAEVFIVDLNEGILPHKSAVLESEIEEERRLLYVGMTRAKDLLHLSSVKEQYGKSMSASRFLDVLQ